LDLSRRKVLITGGAGFIGSHLADRLLRMGCKVTVYDNFDQYYTGKELNLQHNLSNRNYNLVKADILDYEKLLSAAKSSDVIFHEAAQPGVRFSIQNPRKAHEVNATGTLNVLEAARELKTTKIVVASSSSVYGVPRYLPMDEEHPTTPNSPYAASKIAAEKYCLSYNESYRMRTTILRYFSVYGPRGRPDQVIRKFTTEILEGRQPVIYGDGTQTRDFTYVDDIVDATLLAMESDEADGHVFNIGGGKHVTIKDLVSLLIRMLDREDEISPRYEPGYAGDFPHTLADVSKAKKILGYEPKVPLREGIQRFLSWHTDHLRRARSSGPG
jgi:UDP-glucose 4-epimerase